jgi:glycerol-3-phosphate dehydrogenase
MEEPMDDPTALGARRTSWLGDLEHAGASRGVDVLVVGGGVTGAGVALDATARGLSVLLVEQDDFASGTSSRSSKLVHGGLRYLEQGDLALVREALHERELLLTHLAPHLVRPVRFLYPLRRGGWERWYLEAGLTTYDLLAGTVRGSDRHRHLDARATRGVAPSLDPRGLSGAMEFRDAGTDDARLVTTLLRTAAGHGAHCLAGVALTDLVTEGQRVVGGRLCEVGSGRWLDIRARVVVNATGVWTPETEELADCAVPVRLDRSKGVHVVLPSSRIRSESGWITRAGRSVLFVIPWEGAWLVGTTDTPWTGPPADPQATPAEIAYVLDQLNAVLSPVERVEPDEVLGTFAGLRPLVSRSRRRRRAGSTSRLSRTHVVRVSRPGLVTVAGGKLTTYRVMARDAVDAAIRDAGLDAGRSPTHDLPLLGARWSSEQRRQWATHPARRLLDPDRARRLEERYGAVALELLDLVAGRPGLAIPLPGAPGHLLAEAVHATVFEGARRVEDVLERRTRIAFTAPDGGRAARDAVAVAMGEVLAAPGR